LKLMFEHRNYLPSIGIRVAVTAMIGGFARGKRQAKVAMLGGTALIGPDVLVSRTFIED
jgi:hypothetical protein